MSEGFEPKTQWRLDKFDPAKVWGPQAEVDRAVKGRTSRFADVDQCSLIYAAMLDGVLGGEELADYTNINQVCVQKRLQLLAKAGYVKKVTTGGRVKYVPLGANAEDLE